MNDNQILSSRAREGIDACRAGRDDLRGPELADVAREVIESAAAASHFDRVQRCDARLQSAMADVAVPEDLARKLLARLQVTQLTPTDANLEVAPVNPPLATSPHRRRAWLSLALAASLLVGVSTIVVRSWGPAEPVDVATLANVWQEQLTGKWSNMASAPHSMSIPPGLGVRPRGWQSTSAYLGYKAVAYDVSLPRVRAVLFVVSPSPAGAYPTVPPQAPQSSSGGRAVAAWISGTRLCVLVVDGDEKAYRTLIRATQGPLA